jgi:serine/threonine protein kinase
MIGRTLGHYEVVEKLGEGGMGAVFKAKDTHLDRFVALKVLPHEKMSDAERKRRFTQEAKAASALNHPNIITIYDISSSDGVDFIAMEYVEGKTLEALIAEGPLRVADTLKYARQMADALAAAHAAGILHRDLKPANVMVKDSGLVKVLDFGLAKLTDMDTSPHETTRTMSSTRAGQILGTVSYMSPEQAEGKKLDFRSDIFSFGVVLYEMASGQRAFPGDSQASVLAALLRDEPRPVTETRTDMPLELDQLISRCMRKDPARRVQTMADLKAILEDLPETLTKSRLGTTLSTTSAASLPPPPPIPVRVFSPPPPVPVYAPPPPIPAAPPPVQMETKNPKRSRRRAWGIVIALFILLPALLREMRSVFRQEMPTSISMPMEVVILKEVPLTANEGNERTPSFSPDGNQVAYSWNGAKADNFDIYKKPVGDGPPVRLTTDAQEDYAPAWSQDGKTIAFLRRSGTSDTILLVPAAGGSERKIGEAAHSADGYGLAWMHDGRRLIVSDAPSGGVAASLYELSIDTGEKKRITKPAQRGEGDFFPSVSPDGEMVAFVRNPGGLHAELFTLDITDEDETPRRITTLKMDASHPAWREDSHQLIYSAGVAPAPLLWRVQSDGSGKPVPLIGLGPGEDPAVAAQGGRMVYSGKTKDSKNHPLMLVEQFR